MVPAAGLEPATYAFGKRCSIQLSYAGLTTGPGTTMSTKGKNMSADPQILDRIDIRWAVRTRSVIDTAFGKVVVHCRFSIRLGTYDGPCSQRTIAQYILTRGVYAADIDSISCIDGVTEIDQVVVIVNACGIRPEDIVEMIVQDVIVDDVHEIATSILEPGR